MITVVGKHKVRHGDIHDTAEVAYLVAGALADIYYSDPPWGSGNMKYWDTMNKKMNNITTSTGNFDVDKFLQLVLTNAAHHTSGWVVIEYGKRWIQNFKDYGEAAGLTFCDQIETVYANNLPMEILFFHTEGFVELDPSPIYHLKGYRCVKEVFKLLKPASGGIGMDLCCGMGYTAQACIDNDMTFIGNELNKVRLDKTIARLNKDKNR